jgi:exonuclease VII small subunit
MGQQQIYSSSAERQKAYRERLAAQREQELQRKNLPALPAVTSIPGTARWNALIETARASLDAVRSEMQDYSESRTDRWQESEKGEAFSERIAEIEEIISQLEAL